MDRIFYNGKIYAIDQQNSFLYGHRHGKRQDRFSRKRCSGSGDRGR